MMMALFLLITAVGRGIDRGRVGGMDTSSEVALPRQIVKIVAGGAGDGEGMQDGFGWKAGWKSQPDAASLDGDLGLSPQLRLLCLSSSVTP